MEYFVFLTLCLKFNYKAGISSRHGSEKKQKYRKGKWIGSADDSSKTKSRKLIVNHKKADRNIENK